jgi:hypothetical protein
VPSPNAQPRRRPDRRRERTHPLIERCLDSNPESCRSKQASYCNLATHLPINLATHLPANLATHLPNQLSHPSPFWLLKTFPNEKCSFIKSLQFFTISNFSHWKKLSTAELNFERRCQTLIMTFSLRSSCYL